MIVFDRRTAQFYALEVVKPGSAAHQIIHAIFALNRVSSFYRRQSDNPMPNRSEIASIAFQHAGLLPSAHRANCLSMVKQHQRISTSKQESEHQSAFSLSFSPTKPIARSTVAAPPPSNLDASQSNDKGPRETRDDCCSKNMMRASIRSRK